MQSTIIVDNLAAYQCNCIIIINNIQQYVVKLMKDKRLDSPIKSFIVVLYIE
jgi:hypothetical protein